ncbi:transmembrane protein 186-like [Lasioglossum baleicum]|uniref:transmembrane protein 186-like n=1 Tax=Lasioglossum baleicum TaxID=434251 RepID=UPI003FCCB565
MSTLVKTLVSARILSKNIQFVYKMMHLPKNQFYGRLINRLFSNTNINKYCHTNIYKKVINDSTKILKSEKYPDYEVVYTFPYIKHLCAVNIIKRNQTVFTGACTLTCIGARLLDLISTDICLSTIVTSSLLTLTLHVSAIMCNNIIAFVYLRKEDQNVILSYSNYWGKRVDLKTDVMSILPLSETPINICSKFYRILNIKSCQTPLKLFVPYGQIVQEKNFVNIFGMY